MLNMVWMIAAAILSFAAIWQDLRTRTVHVGIPVGMALAGAARQWVAGWQADSLLLWLAMLLLLQGYVGIRHRAWLPDHWLGWGDILFVAAVALWLPPLLFLGWFTATCVLALAGTRLLPYPFRDPNGTIPLLAFAGLLFPAFLAVLM